MLFPISHHHPRCLVRVECSDDTHYCSANEECNQCCAASCSPPYPSAEAAMMPYSTYNPFPQYMLMSVTGMAPYQTSQLVLFLVITSVSAKTTISFYTKATCASDSPSAGDDFKDDNLATSSGVCYRPPSNSVAMKVEEINDGCSGMPPVTCPSCICFPRIMMSLHPLGRIHL